MQSDYMDPDILQSMIDFGFSIGFHGHQHRTQFIEEKYQFGTEKRMVLISAGTLCAGPSQFPPGELRGYNVIELDAANLSATLHQRRMQNQTYGNIIWGNGRFALTNSSHVTFKVQPPPARNNMAEDNRALGAAETQMREKKFAEAVIVLRPIAATNTLAKRMLWDCYVALEDSKAIVAEFYPPSTPAEIVHMADALWEHDRDRLRAMLELDVVKTSDDHSVVQVRTTYNTRLER